MTESPCVRNCCLDQQDICLGCGRSIEEITAWHSASPEQRRQIVQLAKARLTQRNDVNNLKHRVVNLSE